MAKRIVMMEDSDIRLLMHMARWFRSKNPTIANEIELPTEQPETFTTDSLLVKVPSGETLDKYNTSTDVPGELQCDVYQHAGNDGTSTPVKMDYQVQVLNYSKNDLDDTAGHFPVTRTKYGRYVVGSGEAVTTNTCDDLKGFTNDGDMPLTGISLVAIDGTNCRLRDWDLCDLLLSLTERTWNTDVMVVGVDKEANPDECGLYPLSDVYDVICDLTAVVRHLVETVHSVGGNDVCP